MLEYIYISCTDIIIFVYTLKVFPNEFSNHFCKKTCWFSSFILPLGQTYHIVGYLRTLDLYPESDSSQHTVNCSKAGMAMFIITPSCKFLYIQIRLQWLYIVLNQIGAGALFLHCRTCFIINSFL